MSLDDDAILDQSLACLRWHCHREWGDRNALDIFKRLLAKNIKPNGWTPNTHLDIERHQVSSRREKWPTAALAKLPRGHGFTNGEDFDCPIVLAEYQGEQRLLDGIHRVNRWIAAGDIGEHDVNIHTIAGLGQFVELPTVAKRGA